MFRAVSKGAFHVIDTEDMVTEWFSEAELVHILRTGVKISNLALDKHLNLEVGKYAILSKYIASKRTKNVVRGEFGTFTKMQRELCMSQYDGFCT